MDRTSTPQNGSQAVPPDQNDLIARIHNDALNTPASLTNLPASIPRKPRVPADLSSSDSDADRSKPSRHRHKHTRSISNPVSSIFTVRKRQGSTVKPLPELESTDNDNMTTKQGMKIQRRAQPGSKYYATGNCMTCASLVRWPKDLKTFKCTICMTVNDLVPPGNDKAGIASQEKGSEASVEQTSRLPAVTIVQPISLERTRRLTRQCLHAYLSRKLRPQPAQPAPGHSQAVRHGQEADPQPEPPIRLHKQDPRLQRRQTEDPQLSSKSDHLMEYEVSVPGKPLNRRPFQNQSRSYSSSHYERSAMSGQLAPQQPLHHHRKPSGGQIDDAKRIFKPLEDYVVDCLATFDCLNSSFSLQPRSPVRTSNEILKRMSGPTRDPRASLQLTSNTRENQQDVEMTFDLDPKLLLLGDFAENGSWWTGQEDGLSKRSPPTKTDHKPRPSALVKSPQLHWCEIRDWYLSINNAAEGWFSIFEEISKEPSSKQLDESELRFLEQEILTGQTHAQRVLLKATELLLKRPGRKIIDPRDLRFLLIILENPLLHSDTNCFQGLLQPQEAKPVLPKSMGPNGPLPTSGLLAGHHSGVIKRIIGLMSNSSNECHHQLIHWLARYPAKHFRQIKDFVSGFLTYRMLRQNEKKPGAQSVDITAGLIPQMQSGQSGASLHHALCHCRPSNNANDVAKMLTNYVDDWQIKAASRVLALLFAANGHLSARRGDDANSRPGRTVIPAAEFYNSMIDYVDLVKDFESWEHKKTNYSFCQYPFLLSISAKTRILEHDARRQMASKARDAFFDSIMTRRNFKQHLYLDVRRDCLVDDSLTAVSEVIGSGGEDLKKGLRINFRGEEGIDAGGPRKEWFLLLIREVFNPDHGMFVYDDDSQYCYFNPHSFESSDQYFLVGVVVGLAIYNSTILDVALPPFAFRKLLASAPSTTTGTPLHQRPFTRFTLDDLAEYRPRLAHGLKSLLDFDGDVEETFCLNFVIETDRYGVRQPVPLCPGGEDKPVTNANRREYVDLYIQYLLEVKRQFEPFKRGFYTVCGGNAFSLFRPEEIERIVRGSDEPLDITSLRAVADYRNWDNQEPDGSEPVVGWFWESFQQASPGDQRKMLLFITGSDRIPATGAASLTIRLSCLGDDCGRYPVAHTCFDTLSLWRYESKEKLEFMLWRAVHESAGFGLR